MALGQSPQERTREELFEIFGFNHKDYFMEKLASTVRALQEYEIEVSPNLQDKTPAGIYLLKRLQPSGLPGSSILERLARHESGYSGV